MKNGPEKGSIAKETNWEMVEQRLKEEKRRTLRLVDTSEAIKSFRLSSQVVQEAGLVSRETGLIEQQACFTMLREQESLSKGCSKNQKRK